jgi:hypothetical protein
VLNAGYSCPEKFFLWQKHSRFALSFAVLPRIFLEVFLIIVTHTNKQSNEHVQFSGESEEQKGATDVPRWGGTNQG